METIRSIKTTRIILKEPVQVHDRQSVTSPHTLWQVLRQLLQQEDCVQEHSFIVLFNAANRVIAWKKLFSGGVDAVTLDPKIILRYALIHAASSIALAHNHPSGNLEPSHEDITVTRQLSTACHTVGLRLLDHLIIDDHGFTSMTERGLIRV